MAKTKQKFIQGLYKPRHPEKYKGDVSNIVYRSSWELQFMNFCDSSPAVIEWSSEEIAIPYVKPTDNKVHHYFLDFWMKYLSDEPERGEPYWKKSNTDGYSDEEKRKLELIIDDKLNFINVIKGLSETPDPNIGNIGDLYVCVDAQGMQKNTRNVFIKVEGDILRDKDGNPIKKIKKMLIEIKPDNQTRPPKPQKRITTAYKNKAMAWIINDAKWKYATAFAKKNGMEFKILTEHFLKNNG